MPTERFKTIDEFWPYYVNEHSNVITRRLHFIGNTNLFAWLLLALIQRRPSLVIFAVISSYLIAWIGHFFVERNRPATFQYPIWSALCDMRMYYLMWRNEMNGEVSRYINEA
jgi:hypothetical protein